MRTVTSLLKIDISKVEFETEEFLLEGYNAIYSSESHLYFWRNISPEAMLDT